MPPIEYLCKTAILLAALATFGPAGAQTSLAQTPHGTRSGPHHWWQGEIKWSLPSYVGTTGQMKVELEYDERGNLIGTASGTERNIPPSVGPCRHSFVAPGTIEATLRGSHDPKRKAMSLEIVIDRTTPVTWSRICPGSSDRPTFGPVGDTLPEFRQLFITMKPKGDRFMISRAQSDVGTWSMYLIHRGQQPGFDLEMTSIKFSKWIQRAVEAVVGKEPISGIGSGGKG